MGLALVIFVWLVIQVVEEFKEENLLAAIRRRRKGPRMNLLRGTTLRGRGGLAVTRRRPLSRVLGLLGFPRTDEATSWWRKAAEQWAARGVLNVGLLHPRRPVRSPVVPNWKRFWRSLLVTLTRDVRGVPKDVAAGFGVSGGVGRSAKVSEKPVKQLDWQATEERAARMTDRELVGAIRDAQRGAKRMRELEKAGVLGPFKTQAYYHDLMSVYSKELKLRAPAAASGLKD